MREGKVQPNLILDRGLDKLAEIPICDYFKVCAKGTGTEETIENVANTNTYSQAGPDLTVTRTAGTRDFTSDDVGMLLQFDGTKYGKVTAFTDATHVEVDRENTFTNKTMKVFAVEQDWEDATESGVVVIAGNTLTKALADDLVTVDGTPGTVFNIGHVGLAIYFNLAAAAFEIVEFIDADTVRVNIADGPQGDVDVAGDTAALYPFIAADQLLPLSRSTTYSAVARENITFTGPSAASGDIPALDEWERQFKRTFVFPAEEGLDATNNYTEIMFSDVEYPGNNFNVRVKLATPVDVLSATTGGDPSEQLKVTYVLQISVSPHAISGPANPPCDVTESGTPLSGNKTASHAIERFATSTIGSNGQTNTDNDEFDPYNPAKVALSTDTTALDPFGNVVRDNGVQIADLVAADYVPGSFTNTYTGVFGLNEAIMSFRSLMLYSQDASMGVLTYLFTNGQSKDGNHSLTLTFSKTWDRFLG